MPLRLEPSVSLHLSLLRQHLAEMKEHLKLAKARIRVDYEPESLPQVLAEAAPAEQKTATPSALGSHNTSRAETPAGPRGADSSAPPAAHVSD